MFKYFLIFFIAIVFLYSFIWNKLDYLNKILQSNGTLKISQVAADYNMSAIALNKLLHEAGLIRKVNDQWILYKKYME